VFPGFDRSNPVDGDDRRPVDPDELAGIELQPEDLTVSGTVQARFVTPQG